MTAGGASETGSYSLSYATNASGAPLNNRISTYTYDAAGNVTNDGGTYTYDAASRMKTAGGTNYGFDGDGRRVRVQQGGYSSIWYLWSSVLGQPVAEIVGDTGNLFQAYVYGPGGQMVALLSNDGGFYWVHQDHLGSGRKLTDSTGAVRYRGEFDPHGQVVLEVTSGGTGTYASSHKYTGYEREWSTNLDYAKARMYSHNRARFMQPDPLGIGAADPMAPQTLNRYSYVADDPVNYTDPSGMNLEAPSGRTCYGYDILLSNDGGQTWQVIGFIKIYCIDNALGASEGVGGSTRPDPAHVDRSRICQQMADIAQMMASYAIKNFGNGKEALNYFDSAFSNFYAGRAFKTRDDGFALASDGGESRTGPSELWGQGGFKPEFKEADSKGSFRDNWDQTHHFAAHLSSTLSTYAA